MNWQKKPLSEVITLIQTGTTPSTKVPEYFHGQIPWYTPGDIGVSRDLNGSMRYLSQLGVDEGGAKLVEPDTLLVTCIGEIGRVGITRTYATYNQQITGLQFSDCVDVEYAYYWFLHHQTQLEIHTNQAVVSILNNAGLKQIEFTFPPLDEQKRIAAILEEADHARRTRRFTQSVSDTFLQEVFVEMFGDPVTNPMGWEESQIGSVVDSSQYGTSDKSNQEGIGYPILGMGNVTYDGLLDLSEYSYVDLSPDEFEKLRLEHGDIIFNRTNSTELVGKTAMWDVDIEAVLASYLVKLKLKPTVLPEYFVGLLNTPYYKTLFQMRCRKAVGQSNVSPTLLKEFPVLIPPIPMQETYADVVAEHHVNRDRQSESARQAEHLFQTLLHRAFRGEV